MVLDVGVVLRLRTRLRWGAITIVSSPYCFPALSSDSRSTFPSRVGMTRRRSAGYEPLALSYA